MMTPFVPLTDDEHQELDHFLIREVEAPDAITFYILDGYMHAIAIGPTTLMPQQWMPTIWDEAKEMMPPVAQRKAKPHPWADHASLQRRHRPHRAGAERDIASVVHPRVPRQGIRRRQGLGLRLHIGREALQGRLGAAAAVAPGDGMGRWWECKMAGLNDYSAECGFCWVLKAKPQRRPARK